MYCQNFFFDAEGLGLIIHVDIKSTKVSIFMPIFREQTSISLYVHTKWISIVCVCKVVQQLFREDLKEN